MGRIERLVSGAVVFLLLFVGFVVLFLSVLTGSVVSVIAVLDTWILGAVLLVAVIIGSLTGWRLLQAGTGGGEEDSSPARDIETPAQVPTPPEIDVSYDEIDRERQIGAGGNADIYGGTVQRAGKTVPLAIKEPRMSGTVHTAQVERLLAEAETWEKLDDHDHIVGVVDYGSQPLPWIAMEYMDGGHLGERAGEIPPHQALWTALAVTRGVRHAHRRGVAHLDLKPQNILFRAVDDGWDVPKVADWGLSKHLLEHSKSVDGFSPQYAAPEQFDQEFGGTDERTDIYQLGAVFYELCTGKPPFDGKPATVMHNVLTEEPTPPSEVNPELPAALDDVLLKALATEKADRHESVLYLRDELDDLLHRADTDGDGAPAAGTERAESTRRTALTVGAGLLVVGGIGTLGWMALNEDRPARVDNGIDAEFDYQYFPEQTALEITYSDGDRLQAGSVEVTNGEATATWAELAETVTAASIDTGETVRLGPGSAFGDAISPEQEVTIVRTDGEKEDFLGQWNGR